MSQRYEVAGKPGPLPVNNGSLDTLKVILLSGEQVRCHLESIDILQLAGCFRHEEKGRFSPAIQRGEETPKKQSYDPNFPAAHDRCLCLQVPVNAGRLAFSFNHPLAKVGASAWQRHTVRERLSRPSQLLAHVLGGVCSSPSVLGGKCATYSRTLLRQCDQ